MCSPCGTHAKLTSSTAAAMGHMGPRAPWAPMGSMSPCRALRALQTRCVRGVVALLSGERFFRIPTLKFQVCLPCGACLRRFGTLKKRDPRFFKHFSSIGVPAAVRNPQKNHPRKIRHVSIFLNMYSPFGVCIFRLWALYFYFRPTVP